MIYRLTLQHDHGTATITLYGHDSEESAINSIMKMERCPRRSIIKIEDLTPCSRTKKELLSVS